MQDRWEAGGDLRAELLLLCDMMLSACKGEVDFGQIAVVFVLLTRLDEGRGKLRSEVFERGKFNLVRGAIAKCAENTRGPVLS